MVGPGSLPRAARSPAERGRGSSRRALTARAAFRALEERVDFDRRPILLVSDFDGTLSPIVMDPWGAEILSAARRALRRLAGVQGVEVAILSGRTIRDVAERVRVGGARYLGNHGLESGRLGRGRRAASLAVESEARLDGYAAAAERLAAEVSRRIPERWLVVERKPPTVAFHYRQAPDVAGAGRRVAEVVDELDPDGVFVRFTGRRVLELRPPGAAAKGDALRALLEELRPATTIVLGDDRSDLLAFEVLRELSTAGGTEGVAIAVQAHAEAPPEVAAAADLVLASPVEAARLLGLLARRLTRPSAD
jgi:trehalose-phosphatase